MSAKLHQAAPAARNRTRDGLVARLLRVPWIALALLLLLWIVPPLVPVETGLRFGLWFQVFFTVALLLGMLFFWFLGQGRMPYPTGAFGVLLSVAGVYLATVGLLVAIAVVFPQFGLPRPQQGAEGLQAVGRGRALFFREDVACFRCHAVAGTGGIRGPDLTQIGARAGDRVPGLSAEAYLRGKVRAGATYQFNVPGYVPIMPGFGQILTEEQLADLLAYLLSLQ